MTARHARSLKSVGILFAGLLCFAGARRAQAQSPACVVDTDCPNSACGGDVCTHTSGSFACNEANTQAGKGFDGWCADANGNAKDELCKCRGLGATCVGFFCAFTIPGDAPPTGVGGAGASSGGSGGGAAGASGSGGASGSAGAAGGRGGSTGTAGGAAGNTGGRGSGGDGGGGGCSVASAAANASGSVALLVVVAALARRRRSGRARQ